MSAPMPQQQSGPQTWPQPQAADESGDYTVEVVDKVGAAWDAIVTNFADLCLEQTAAFMTARWGASRLAGLVLRDAITGEPEAAALAVIAALPVLKRGLAYIKFGPLWRHRDRPARPHLLSAALDALKREFVKSQGLLLRVMPPADPEFSQIWQQRTQRANLLLCRLAEFPKRYL